MRRKIGAIHEAVRWVDLERIEIQTTDEGPFAEDVFGLLFARDGSGCVVPGSAAGPLLDHVKNLGGFGFDGYQAIASAMGSTSNASFLVWRRELRSVDAAPARV